MAKVKLLDDVKGLNNNYENKGIKAGMVGTIIDAEIRDNCFNVIFIDERVKDKEFMSVEENFLSLEDDIIYPIKIEDLSVVKENN